MYITELRFFKKNACSMKHILLWKMLISKHVILIVVVVVLHSSNTDKPCILEKLSSTHFFGSQSQSCKKIPAL
jgi:hypothetical protein